MHRLLLALAVLPISGAALRAADPPRRLNVIVILADDLGWTDLACYGSDLHETPHLDRLAKDGMKFT
jgi:arylsulfatase A-like enzyme